MRHASCFLAGMPFDRVLLATLLVLFTPFLSFFLIGIIQITPGLHSPPIILLANELELPDNGFITKKVGQKDEIIREQCF